MAGGGGWGRAVDTVTLNRGVEAHTYSSSTQRLKGIQGQSGLQSKTFLRENKEIKLGIVIHACNPSTHVYKVRFCHMVSLRATRAT